MGKNWKGHKYTPPGGSNDLSSCRGLGVVIASCDSAREREASKELVDLFNEVIGEMKEIDERDDDSDCNDDNIPKTSAESVQSMLFKELDEIRQQKHATSQNAMSINSGTCE